MVNVYIDTSVIGGCFDPEFKEWSMALFEEFKTGSKFALISELTLEELEPARAEIKNKVSEIPPKQIINLYINDEAIKLADEYISGGALTDKSYSDALHIAIATLNNAEVLASWNFKHIVNLNRIRIYNSINLRLGYRLLEIRSPREILNFNNHGKR